MLGGILDNVDRILTLQEKHEKVKAMNNAAGTEHVQNKLDNERVNGASVKVEKTATSTQPQPQANKNFNVFGVEVNKGLAAASGAALLLAVVLIKR